MAFFRMCLADNLQDAADCGGLPRWARLTRKSLSRRRADTGSSANSLGCCFVFFARLFVCNSGALFSVSNIFCLFVLLTDLKALISESIICLGVRNPDGSAMFWERSHSAIPFQMFCSSSVST